MKKLKMSNKKFRAIMIPALSILVILAFSLTYAANYWRVVLDTYLGRGESRIVNTTDISGLDLDYYGVQYSNDTESLAAAINVALQIASEGEVLMKNAGGTLPLDASAKITPFGYRYIEPVWGGTGSGNVDTNKDYVYSPERALKEAFGNAAVNATVESLLKSSKPYQITADGISLADSGAGEAVGFAGEDHTIIEFDPDIYHTDAVKASCAGTVGLVFIARFGGETWDLQRTPYIDGTPHQLALSSYEQEMIDFAAEYCDNVVVILNASNQMELGALEASEDVDAILWVGGPGGLGFKAMAQILCGEVNPSGRTADTYYADFSIDPALQNFGEYQYANSTQIELTGQREGAAYHPNYLEYEEGVYVGYRFYETAYYEKEQLQAGAGDSWYNGWRTAADHRGTGVVYPFGYGLSYTSFTQEITDISENEGMISIAVRVTNTGERAGKDTVQIYYSAPYTDYDRENGIEKAAVNLAAFGKTGELLPGASETVTVTFERDDMASYSYRHLNSDGTKGCYILEAGDYTISCRKNAHELYSANGCERSYTVASTEFFEGENLRDSDQKAQSVMNEDGSYTLIAARSQYDSSKDYAAVNNKFENLNRYMSEDAVTNLTRADWGSEPGEGSFPTAPNPVESIIIDREGPITNIHVDITDRVMSDVVLAEASVSTGGGNYDYENDPELGNVEGSKIYAPEAPAQGANNGLSAIDLRGADYYDPMWDQLLDQIDFTADYEQIRQMLYNTNYSVGGLTSVGIQDITNADGPVGLTKTMGAGSSIAGAGACAWPSEVVAASTFNTDLIKKMGETLGEEAFQFQSGEGVYTNGWYAPGMDMHRSPFNGRNFEYYSEDPTLSGKMGAAVITGTANKGLVAYMKHFVLNDKELMQKLTYTWCNEQTLREIYLRPYEIAVKEATMQLNYVSGGERVAKTARAVMGIMTSHNHIGATWAGSNYNLVTGVVRDEWGFQGCIVTDNATGYATSFDRMVRSGNDMWMGANMGNACAYDMVSPTAQTAMRNAIHNILYAYVNSNLMQGMAPGSSAYYAMSPWEIALIAVDVVVGLLVAAGVAWIILRGRAAKKRPERYIGTPEGNAILAQIPVDLKKKRLHMIILCVILAAVIILLAVGAGSLLRWYNQLMTG